MASNGLTSDPDEYLNTFPEAGGQRNKHRNDEEDTIVEEIDEVNMCKYHFMRYYIKKYIYKKYNNIIILFYFNFEYYILIIKHIYLIIYINYFYLWTK